MTRKHNARPSHSSTKKIDVTSKRLNHTAQGRQEFPPPRPEDNFQYVIIAGVCLILYANSLDGSFVHDDLFAVVRNKDVVSSNGISDVFSDDYWGKPITDPRSHKSYRPLTVLTFRLNFIVSGLHPFSFHLVNVLLHTLVSVMFLMVCQDFVFTEDAHSSFHAALLFAVHPIHTEAVSGIVGRADVLACLFFQLSFSLYGRFVTRGEVLNKGRSHLFGSVVFAACAMFSKENGTTVLAVNAGYDVLHNMRIFRNGKSLLSFPARCLLKRIAMVTTIALLLLLARIWVMGGTMPQFLPEDNPASFSGSCLTRILTYSYLIFFNCWLLLCPAVLSYDWQVGSIPLVESVWDPRNILTLAVFLVLSAMALRALLLQNIASNKPLFIGLLFLSIPFLPASNLFITVGFVVAERILYIPSMGYCILVVYGASKITTFLPRKDLYRRLHSAASVFVILILSAQTVTRNTVWHSRESLFRSGLRTLPGNAKVHYNWANYQSDSGNVTSAIYHYKETIRLYPDHASAHNNLATLLTNVSDKEHHLKKALSIDAFHVNAHVNLGVLYSKLGNQSLAAAHLKQAVLTDPENYEAVSNLASILTDRGEFEEAERYHEKGIALEPGNADLMNNYGVFLLKTDRDAEARAYFQKTLAIQPDHVTAMGNLGLLEKKLGRMNQAEVWYTRALSVERSPATLKGLAKFYLSVKEWGKAKDLYKEILALTPDDVDTILILAQIFINMDHLLEGEDCLERAVSLFPHHLEFSRALANIKVLLRKFDQGKKDPKLPDVFTELKLAQNLQHMKMTFLEIQDNSQALFHSNAAIMLSVAQTEVADDVKARIHFEHGNILKNLGKYDEALKEYEVAISLDSRLSGAFLNMGGIHHIKGNYKEAKRYYLRALSLDPENPILKENLKKLSRLMKQREHGAG